MILIFLPQVFLHLCVWFFSICSLILSFSVFPASIFIPYNQTYAKERLFIICILNDSLNQTQVFIEGHTLNLWKIVSKIDESDDDNASSLILLNNYMTLTFFKALFSWIRQTRLSRSLER